MMRRFLAIAILAIISVSAVAAPPKEKKEKINYVTTIFAIDVDSPKSMDRVKHAISSEPGVKSVSVDAKRHQATVKFNAARNSNEQLIRSFRKIDIKANVINNKPKKH